MLDSEDLLTLRDFSEPALLHTLRVRFSRRESYTAVGSILVSVNPYSYHNYEETYGEAIMDM
jgi:myosin heavy subunit